MAHPTWLRLRELGWMVVDGPKLLLALYPTENGSISVVFAHPEDQEPNGFTLPLEILPLLRKQLEAARDGAQRQIEWNLESDAAKLAFEVLDRLRGGV